MALSDWRTIKLIKRLSRLDFHETGNVAVKPSAPPAVSSGPPPTLSGDSGGICFARRLYRLFSLSSEVCGVQTEDLQRVAIGRLSLLNLLSMVHFHNELDGVKQLLNAFPESKSELLGQVIPLSSPNRSRSRSSASAIRVWSGASFVINSVIQIGSSTGLLQKSHRASCNFFVPYTGR